VQKGEQTKGTVEGGRRRGWVGEKVRGGRFSTPLNVPNRSTPMAVGNSPTLHVGLYRPTADVEHETLN
jgi:hypothetical protein